MRILHNGYCFISQPPDASMLPKSDDFDCREYRYYRNTYKIGRWAGNRMRTYVSKGWRCVSMLQLRELEFKCALLSVLSKSISERKKRWSKIK